jgi:DNA-binding NtrC family response regulator
MAVTLERQGAAGERWRPKILCVGDEPQVLDGLRDSLRREFDVSVATSGAEGLELLRGDPTGFSIVISDMRSPTWAEPTSCVWRG